MRKQLRGDLKLNCLGKVLRIGGSALFGQEVWKGVVKDFGYFGTRWQIWGFAGTGELGQFYEAFKLLRAR